MKIFVYFFMILTIHFIAGCSSLSLTNEITPTQLSFTTKTIMPPTEKTANTRTQSSTFTQTPSLTATTIYYPIFTPKPKWTLTPSLTSTPVPPLKPYSWISEPVLIEFNSWGGDGCCGILAPPMLILYSDGKLFQSNWIEINGENKLQVFYKQLSLREVCAFLNTIDQFGFFDYDPSTYRSPDSDNMPIDGAPHFVINVNAWRKKDITPYALGSYIYSEGTWEEDCPECPSLPPIPPSLRNTFNLLNNYPVEGAEIYNPDRIAVLIEQVDSDKKANEWPLTNPKLSDLFLRASQNTTTTGQELLITKDEARSVYDAVGQSIELYDGFLFHEGQLTYRLYVRPLLPFEAPAELDAIRSQIPSQSFENPGLPLSCKPSDGILPISDK
jgi:hypothetical protein